MRTEKQSVREFYDSFGWQKGRQDIYMDTEAFVDMRPAVAAYWHHVHQRVKSYLEPQGQYFLDAGSGAIPYPEYLDYSVDYRRRICIDFSETALKEARAKLQTRGFYVQADLTNLPFKDQVFDAIVSAHVLYHIPHDEQAQAVRELLRMLRLEGRGVIIYAWPGCLLTRVATWCRVRSLLGRIPGVRACWRKIVKPLLGIVESRVSVRPSLYFHAHPYQWFETVIPREWNVDIRSWSSVDSVFTRTFIPDNIAGALFLRFMLWLDSVLPHGMVKIGAYPMVVISKP